MALNISFYEQKAAKINRGGGDFFKFVDGRNIVRIFTFQHKVTKGDYTRGIYVKGSGHAPKVGSKTEELDRECFVHFTDDGAKNCSRLDSCPHCKDASRFLASKSKQDQITGKKKSARQQFNVNAVDVSDPSGMKLLSMPQSVYTKILSYLTSGEYDAEELFGIKGRDFIVDRDSKASPSNMYSVMLRDEKKSKPLEKDLAKTVVDLYGLVSLDAPTEDGPAGPGDSKEEDDEDDEDEEGEIEDTDEDEDTEDDEDEDDEDEEDDEDDEDDEEDENPQMVEDGETVHFKYEKKVLEGAIEGYDGGQYDVAVGEDIYTLNFEDFTVGAAPAKAAKKKTKKKAKKS